MGGLSEYELASGASRTISRDTEPDVPEADRRVAALAPREGAGVSQWCLRGEHSPTGCPFSSANCGCGCHERTSSREAVTDPSSHWCSLCQSQIMPGQSHPDVQAHAEDAKNRVLEKAGSLLGALADVVDEPEDVIRRLGLNRNDKFDKPGRELHTGFDMGNLSYGGPSSFVKPRGWTTHETHSDEPFRYVWEHPGKKGVLTWTEGDVDLERFQDPGEFDRGRAERDDFYNKYAADTTVTDRLREQGISGDAPETAPAGQPSSPEPGPLPITDTGTPFDPDAPGPFRVVRMPAGEVVGQFGTEAEAQGSVGDQLRGGAYIVRVEQGQQQGQGYAWRTTGEFWLDPRGQVAPVSGQRRGTRVAYHDGGPEFDMVTSDPEVLYTERTEGSPDIPRRTCTSCGSGRVRSGGWSDGAGPDRCLECGATMDNPAAPREGSRKEAVNYLLDGTPIYNGFDVEASEEEAGVGGEADYDPLTLASLALDDDDYPIFF